LYLFISNSLGNLFTAQVNERITAAKQAGASLLEGANYFWFFTAFIGVTTLLFLVWSQFYRGRTYIQGTEG
jgi:POT family proton-dependent oligopeptide transporter